jgi:putative hydrolase of the HAD superfamily
VTIDAVIFDWGGTLTPWHTIRPDEAWSAATPDPDVARRLAAAEGELWRRQHDEHRSASIADVLAAAGVEPTHELLAGYHAWWEPHTFTDPDAPGLLRALRERNIKIGVLSNTLWERANHELIFARDGLSELIDAAVYSSEIEWTKPHPSAFRAILDALGIDQGERAVFVGDRRFDDIHGAQSVGMRTVLIPHSEIPDEQRGHTEGEPDAVIERLADLLPIIDQWRKV